MRRLSREGFLVLITALPLVATAVLVFSRDEAAYLFLESQLVANTIFTVGSIGVGVMLSSMPLPSPMLPPRWARIAPSLILLCVAAIAWVESRPNLVAAALIADLLFASCLLRISGHLFISRTVLLLQFLPLIGPGGSGLLGLILILLHYLLVVLKTYRPAEEGHGIGLRALAGAWSVSTVKDFFFRGHYLALYSLDLAGPAYAALLRFLDIISRPTDYVYQRLVDQNCINGRLRRILMFIPIVACVSVVAVLLAQVVPTPSVLKIAFVGLSSALIFVTKYLAFEQNARLRHEVLTCIYVFSLLLALPVLAWPGIAFFPLPYLTLALAISLLLLLRWRSLPKPISVCTQ